jgi:hypothetical protein
MPERGLVSCVMVVVPAGYGFAPIVVNNVPRGTLPLQPAQHDEIRAGVRKQRIDARQIELAYLA